MKAFLAILALCLAASNAAVMPASSDYEGILQDAFNQVKQLQLQAEELLQQHYEQAALEPTLQVDAALEDIEALRADHQQCVAPVQDVLSEIVNNMFDDMSVCEATTHADAGTISKDVLIVTAEVLLDAYELAKLYKKCEAYTNTALKASCFTKFSVKLSLFVNDLRKTITDMVNNGQTQASLYEVSTRSAAGTITKDVLIVTAEVLLDAYELAKLYKKCEAYTNTALKASCFTKFSVKIGLYVNDLRKTITDMVNNSQNQFAAVLAAGETCNSNASERAVQQLQYVRSNVNACIAGH